MPDPGGDDPAPDEPTPLDTQLLDVLAQENLTRPPAVPARDDALVALDPETSRAAEAALRPEQSGAAVAR